MKKRILTDIACFIAGIGIGVLLTPADKHINTPRPLTARLSSQGRAEIEQAVSQVNDVLNDKVGDIMADKTRMLQAITAASPDRAAADFHLSGIESKFSEAQAQIDKIILDALEKMPAVDRRAYMDFYLKSRPNVRLQGVVLPLTAATGFAGMDREMTLSPRFPTVDPI